MRKGALALGSGFALLAVILGAFAAHTLENALAPEALDAFETGVRYQMYHGLALLALGLRSDALHLRLERATVILFTSGVVLFSFSIYLLSLREVLGANLSWLGPVTPLGGTLMIIGWTFLLVDAVRLFTRKEG